MKKPRLITGFETLSDADFEQKAQHIIASVAANPAFAAANPSIAVMQEASSLYSERLLAAANLGRTEIALKNQARTQLEGLLVQLGSFVMNIANGDIALLTASGYTLAKTGELRKIDNPGNVTLVNGITSGSLQASVKSVSGATSYVHEIADTLNENDPVWTSVTTTTCKYTYTNLTPGKQYWVRVAAIGARNQIAYSPVSSQFAQ